jgi:hypothetical protein
VEEKWLSIWKNKKKRIRKDLRIINLYGAEKEKK